MEDDLLQKLKQCDVPKCNKDSTERGRCSLYGPRKICAVNAFLELSTNSLT
jgi:hypothetical protein